MTFRLKVTKLEEGEELIFIRLAHPQLPQRRDFSLQECEKRGIMLSFVPKNDPPYPREMARQK